MRIVVASCSVIYTGRGDTQLPQAVRAIIFKDDGSVAVHNDKSNKPLNYMGKGNVLTETVDEEGTLLVCDTRKESLQIRLHHIISDTSFELDLDDTGLVRDGTEDHLQAWIANNPESLGAGYTLVGREYPTGNGPVDLLVRDKEGNPVAVEVKRVASLNTVGQILRYVTALEETPEFEGVRGMIAALDIRPPTLKLAAKRGIACVTLPATWREMTTGNDNI